MLLLPPFSADPRRRGLPMADRSAALVAEALLVGPDPVLEERLAEQWTCDPPFLLWAVCHRAESEAEPCSLKALAAWFFEHTLGLLRWQKGIQEECEPTVSQVDSWALLVLRDLETAELAAHLARPEGEAVAAEARLLGLLRQAEPWFAAIGQAEEGLLQQRLRPWVADESRASVRAHVLKAVSLLDEASDTSVSQEDLDACKRRAAEGSRRWLEPVPGPGARLPLLAARLARLADLESHFDEVLETEKLEAMAEFAAGAGHEINNPIAVIAGRAQLFLQDEKDPERRRALALINAQAKRVYEMIADMRLFARPPEPHPEPTDLVTLVDAVVEDLAPTMAEEAISLVRTGAPGPVVLQIDPIQLTVALRAMCRNASEAIGHGGRVEIELRDAEERVEIRVIDDGPGLDAEARRHLFDPYYSARQAGRGLGLGLSKCWRIIVTNHHGRIDVASRPGGKTVFTITLPRGRA